MDEFEKLKIYATPLKWGHAREVISRMWTVRRLNDDLSSLTKITTNNEGDFGGQHNAGRFLLMIRSE